MQANCTPLPLLSTHPHPPRHAPHPSRHQGMAGAPSFTTGSRVAASCCRFAARKPLAMQAPATAATSSCSPARRVKKAPMPMAWTAYTLTRMRQPASTNMPQFTTAPAALAFACLTVEMYLHDTPGKQKQRGTTGLDVGGCTELKTQRKPGTTQL